MFSANWYLIRDTIGKLTNTRSIWLEVKMTFGVRVLDSNVVSGYLWSVDPIGYEFNRLHLKDQYTNGCASLLKSYWFWNWSKWHNEPNVLYTSG